MTNEEGTASRSIDPLHVAVRVNKFFIRQIPEFGLGNFICMTPALQAFNAATGIRIPILFSDAHLAECFTSAPFLDPIKSLPSDSSLKQITTRCEWRNQDESDYDAWCRFFGVQIGLPPYVDRPDATQFKKLRALCRIEKKRKRVALFCGCLGDFWFEAKRIAPELLKYIVNHVAGAGYEVLILGSRRDKNRYWKSVQRDAAIDLLGKTTLREALAALATCDFFISNDTGLYHSAAALGIPGTVFWHGTDIVKNRAPFPAITHIQGLTSNDPRFYEAVNIFLAELKACE